MHLIAMGIIYTLYKLSKLHLIIINRVIIVLEILIGYYLI